MYIRVKDGVRTYPFDLRVLKNENPNVSFPDNFSASLLEAYGVYPVTRVAPPAPTLTADPVEQLPQQINGVWTQAWSLVPVSAEEATRRQNEAQDEAYINSIKADAFVKNFVAMTPAQVTAFIDSNTATLAQMRTVVNKMALMLLLLAKRSYR